MSEQIFTELTKTGGEWSDEERRKLNSSIGEVYERSHTEVLFFGEYPADLVAAALGHRDFTLRVMTDRQLRSKYICGND